MKPNDCALTEGGASQTGWNHDGWICCQHAESMGETVAVNGTHVKHYNLFLLLLLVLG
jgi:hypothetical protein